MCRELVNTKSQISLKKSKINYENRLESPKKKNDSKIKKD